MMALPASLGATSRPAASMPPNAPIWDSASVSAPMALSVGDTTVTLPINNSMLRRTVRASKPIMSGKWFWEVSLKDCITGSGPTTGCGIADSGFGFATKNLGSDSTASAGGLWLSGGLFFSGTSSNQGITFSPGDVMMFAFDLGAGSLWVGKNGTWIGNPSAGTGASKTGLSTALTYYPAATPWSSDASHAVVLQIRGDGNAEYAAPSGFMAYGR